MRDLTHPSPFKLGWLLAVLLGIAPVIAQGGSCPAIVQQALQSVDAVCAKAGRNQACYGSLSLEVQPRQGTGVLRFDQVGDIADVAQIQSMRLSPMDTSSSQWGVALMRLQASLGAPKRPKTGCWSRRPKVWDRSRFRSTVWT